MIIRYWGVRGSIPSPLTGAKVREKILKALKIAQNDPSFGEQSESTLENWVDANLPFEVRSTYGGNTTCVEVRCGKTLIIIDMGTGLRELGSALMPETLEAKGLSGIILQSHVHWDHIQGLPFFNPLYMPKGVFKNKFIFYGGKEWDANLETVLKGQMDHPVFPVMFGELKHTGMEMEFHTIHDGWTITIQSDEGPIIIKARKLHHPQETFGYRITFNDKVFCFTTDHEPYGNDAIPVPLKDLVAGADLWTTDCQYSLDDYLGVGSVQKLNWGHSYPEYIAKVARAGSPLRIMTTHHDPAASDYKITELATFVETLCDIPTKAAYEGMEIAL
ncbi:MAG: MBL fold metallo-hydrolase [Patescibacteria group bacterium]